MCLVYSLRLEKQFLVVILSTFSFQYSLIFLFSLFTTENLFLSLPGLSFYLTFKFCYSLKFIPWLFSFLKFLYPFWTIPFSLMTSITILRTNVSYIRFFILDLPFPFQDHAANDEIIQFINSTGILSTVEQHLLSVTHPLILIYFSSLCVWHQHLSIGCGVFV